MLNIPAAVLLKHGVCGSRTGGPMSVEELERSQERISQFHSALGEGCVCCTNVAVSIVLRVMYGRDFWTSA